METKVGISDAETVESPSIDGEIDGAWIALGAANLLRRGIVRVDLSEDSSCVYAPRASSGN